MADSERGRTSQDGADIAGVLDGVQQHAGVRRYQIAAAWRDRDLGGDTRWRLDIHD